MFWKSVLDGLLVLTYWETYVAGLVYLVFLTIPGLLFVLFFNNSRQGQDLFYSFAPVSFPGLSMTQRITSMLGWFYAEFIEPSFEIIGLIVFLFILAPIILGFSSNAAWSLPWRIIVSDPIFMIGLFIGLLFANFIYNRIPILENFESLRILWLGGLTLGAIVAILGITYPEIPFHKIKLMPSFFQIVGYVLLGFVTQILSLLVTIIVRPEDVDEFYFDEKSVGLNYINFAILGAVPVFMYGAWLGCQLKNLTSG